MGASEEGAAIYHKLSVGCDRSPDPLSIARNPTQRNTLPSIKGAHLSMSLKIFKAAACDLLYERTYHRRALLIPYPGLTLSTLFTRLGSGNKKCCLKNTSAGLLGEQVSVRSLALSAKNNKGNTSARDHRVLKLLHRPHRRAHEREAWQLN